MADVSILLKGNLYFFYRPKVEHDRAHQLEDVQRFFMVLKPDNKPTYTLLIVGRKRMPEEEKGESFFAFVDKVTENAQNLSKAFEGDEYSTSTRGERHIPPVRAVAEGKFILAHHDRHTHLFYQLEAPSKPGEVQEDFHLQEQGDYIISIKNPDQPSPAYARFQPSQKVDYSKALKSKFGDRRFIPLDPPDFLFYEGAEIILTAKATADIAEKEATLEKCLEEIPEADLSQHFKSLQTPESLAPLLKKHWA